MLRPVTIGFSAYEVFLLIESIGFFEVEVIVWAFLERQIMLDLLNFLSFKLIERLVFKYQKYKALLCIYLLSGFLIKVIILILT